MPPLANVKVPLDPSRILVPKPTSAPETIVKSIPPEIVPPVLEKICGVVPVKLILPNPPPLCRLPPTVLKAPFKLSTVEELVAFKIKIPPV